MPRKRMRGHLLRENSKKAMQESKAPDESPQGKRIVNIWMWLVNFTVGYWIFHLPFFFISYFCEHCVIWLFMNRKNTEHTHTRSYILSSHKTLSSIKKFPTGVCYNCMIIFVFLFKNRILRDKQTIQLYLFFCVINFRI